MVANHRDVGRRHQGREPGHELHGRHHAMGASPTRRLDPVGDAPVVQHLDSIERERRPRAVAHEPLAPDFFVPDDDKPPPGVSLAAKG